MEINFVHCIAGLMFLVAGFLNFRRAHDKARVSDGTKFHTVAVLNVFVGVIFLCLGIARLAKH